MLLVEYCAVANICTTCCLQVTARAVEAEDRVAESMEEATRGEIQKF